MALKYLMQSQDCVCSLALCLRRTSGVKESMQKREGNAALIGMNGGEKDIRSKCKARMQSKDDITVTQGNTLATLQSIAGIIKHDIT
jgi:hypothetical protein